MPELPDTPLGPESSEPLPSTVWPDNAQDLTPPSAAGTDKPVDLCRTAAVRAGRFTIKRLHAQGGLGQVSLARDEKLRRHVALKEIRPDRRSSAARRRFLTEAEITGQLEHPGIVPIYTLDEDDAGEPYYAMRFIQGRTFSAAIQAYHREPTSLVFRDLLQRFISVCQTLAYAHSRGIIHRDLKPENVMLGDYGETLVVDWGLAKQIEVRDEESGKSTEEFSGARPADAGVDPDALTEPPFGAQTQQGEAVGTPAYMPPEQARGDGERVGPAADIFSLGGVLYTILTGRAPFCGTNVKEALENARAGAVSPPRAVNAAAPRALEAVCLKAMAFRPEDRYAGAKELAADLGQWLADEPVSAYAEPWTARLRRWSRRRRALVSSGLVALLFGVAALTGIMILVQQHAAVVEGQRNELAANYAELQTAHKHEAALLKRDWQTLVLATSETEIEHLARQKELSAEQRDFLTNAIGCYAEHTLETAATEQERADQANAYHRLGRMNTILGRLRDGETAFRRAAALLAQLAAEFPKTADHQRKLALEHLNLGGVLRDQGRRQAAKEEHQKALTILAKLAAEFPEEPIYRRHLAAGHNSLANVLADLGQRPGAEQEYRRALDLQEKLATDYPKEPLHRLELARTNNNLGLLLAGTGQRAAAEQAYRRSLDNYLSLATIPFFESLYRHEAALCRTNLGLLLAELGQRPEAEQEYRQALRLLELLTADFPAVPQYRFQLARTHNTLGANLVALGQRSEAEQEYRRAVQMLEKLAAEFPAMTEHRLELARAHHNLAAVLRELGRQAEAEQEYRRALDLAERLAAEFPDPPDYRQQVARSAMNLSNLLKSLGRLPEAEQAGRRALDLQEKLVADAPNVPQYRSELAINCVNFGMLMSDQGRVEASLEWYAKAIGLLEPLIRKEPKLPERLNLRDAYFSRARALDKLGRHAEAIKDWDQLIELNIEEKYRMGLRFLRAHSLVRAGEHARAVADANAVAESKEVSAANLYDLSCDCALAAAAVRDDPKLQDQYAARAVELLERAVAKGYKDIERLKKDENLKALRERDDFKRLLTKLPSS